MDIKLKYRAWVGEKHADIANNLINSDIETFAIEFAEWLVKNCFIPDVTSSADLEDDFYDDEYYENQPNDYCPKCGRHYDDIDFDYQSCSKCGWDAEKETFGEIIEPTDEDFMNGDADLLTGRWV